MKLSAILVGVIISALVVQAQGALAATELYVSPAQTDAGLNEEFRISVDMSTDDSIYGVQFFLDYDPDLVSVSSIVEGAFLQEGGIQTFCAQLDNDPLIGRVEYACVRFGTQNGVNGTGNLLNLTFQAGMEQGVSAFDINGVEITNDKLEYIDAYITDGAVGVDAFTIHLTGMPTYYKKQPHYSGAGTAQMILNFILDSVSYPALTQDDIYSFAHQYNLAENTLMDELDARAMDAALGHFDPYDEIVSNSYDRYDVNLYGNEYQGYNYDIYSEDPSTNPNAMEDYIKEIVHWMAFNVTQEAWWLHGDLVAEPNTPGAIPLYGSYSNWVAVNGFASSSNPTPSENPYFFPEITVFGFWLTDPATDGIGSHVYVTATEAASTYFKPMSTNDTYDGLLLQVAEPSEENEEIKIVVKEKEDDPENLIFAFAASEDSYDAKTLKKLVRKRGWEDIVDSFLLEDQGAVNAFSDAKIKKPVLVDSLDGEDYYLVKFDKKVNGKWLTSGVIMLSTEGAFLQASWNDHPEKYMITKKQSIKAVTRSITNELNHDTDMLKQNRSDLKDEIKHINKDIKKMKKGSEKNALRERKKSFRNMIKTINEEIKSIKKEAMGLKNTVKNRANANLVWSSEFSNSPFFPVWQISFRGKTWQVQQDGSVQEL